MNTLKLYTIKNSEGKFYHPTMGGGIIWNGIPDYVNAATDRDKACGWKHRLSTYSSLPVEVAELTLSWD